MALPGTEACKNLLAKLLLGTTQKELQALRNNSARVALELMGTRRSLQAERERTHVIFRSVHRAISDGLVTHDNLTEGREPTRLHLTHINFREEFYLTVPLRELNSETEQMLKERLAQYMFERVKKHVVETINGLKPGAFNHSDVPGGSHEEGRDIVGQGDPRPVGSHEGHRPSQGVGSGDDAQQSADPRSDEAGVRGGRSAGPREAPHPPRGARLLRTADRL